MGSSEREPKAEKKPKEKKDKKPKEKKEKKDKREQHANAKRSRDERDDPLATAKKTKKPSKSLLDDAGAKDVSVQEYLEKHEVVVHEEGAPPPCLRLDHAPFPGALVQMLTVQPGFTTPSVVQATSWPIAITGRDVLAIAKTGSGKTLGFLLPVLTRCQKEKPKAKGAPLGLVMAPTRELGLQIAAEATKFGEAVNCRVVAVYGGASKSTQAEALQRGCELVVGTPGRIKDLLCGAEAAASTKSLTMLVLDEADRLLDMGFERDIRHIVYKVFAERKRQTFLYSATWPPEVEGFASDLLHNAVKITVGSGGYKLTANKSVTQRVHVVKDSERWEAFVKLLKPFGKGGAEAGNRVIVFANMKVTVARILKHCQDAGFLAASISGDRSQSQREATIRKFKTGEVTVVIATDVAARGLDIKGIGTHASAKLAERVINYELPMDDFQDYIHRIGRTGRAGATGQADSLFTDGDRLHAKELIRILSEAGQEVPPDLSKFTPQSKKFSDSDDED